MPKPTDDEATPATSPEPSTIRVKANVHLHDLRPGEEGDVPDTEEVRAQIERGLLSRA